MFDAAAEPTAPAPRRGRTPVLRLAALACAYWTAIEIWVQLLNQLNGVGAKPDLLAGRVLGVAAAALLSLGILGLVRNARIGTLAGRMALGATAAVGASALYALSMFPIGQLVPVTKAPAPAGLPSFAWETLFFLIPFALWTVIVLVLESGRAVQEREARLAEALIAAREAEIRALHYQINPHFLYNALNSLSTLILDGRPEQADQMVGRLAAFFRANLASDPLADVRLADELAKQRLYLSLEELRYRDRLRIEVDAPAGLEDALAPSLILQPLVENAVKHGVHEPGRTTTIAIRAWRDGGQLRLQVADDGPGSGVGGGAGLGLDNVRRRLRARYGATARLETACGPEGFVATISLPLEFAAAEAGAA